MVPPPIQTTIEQGLDEIFDRLHAGYYDMAQVEAQLKEYLQTAHAEKLEALESRVLLYLGVFYAHQHQFTEALENFERAYTLAEACGYVRVQITSLNNRAAMFSQMDDRVKEKEMLLRALELCERHPELKSRWIVVLNNLGGVHLVQFEFETAAAYFQRSLEVYETLPLAERRAPAAVDHIGRALSGLAAVQIEHGEYEQAHRNVRQAEVHFANSERADMLLMPHLIRVRLAFYNPQFPSSLEEELMRSEQFARAHLERGVFASMIGVHYIDEAGYWHYKKQATFVRRYAQAAYDIYQKMGDQAMVAKAEGLLRQSETMGDVP